jgi:hypothetical protein
MISFFHRGKIQKLKNYRYFYQDKSKDTLDKKAHILEIIIINLNILMF